MRRLLAAFPVLFVLALAPSEGRAGWIVEASIGKGAMVKPETHAEPVNVMIAPGYSVLGLLRLELGIVNSLPDTKNSKYDLQLRPMVVIAPPLFPLYGRAILAVSSLVADGPTEIAYGGALGVKFGVGIIGVFAEVGALPRKRDLGTGDELVWVVEGRAGAYLSF